MKANKLFKILAVLGISLLFAVGFMLLGIFIDIQIISEYNGTPISFTFTLLFSGALFGLFLGLRRWKQGVIAFVASFLALALLSLIRVNISLKLQDIVIPVLPVFFAMYIFPTIYRWLRDRRERPIVPDRVVRTKIVAIYECANCMGQYSKSETCPNCGSPYRRTLKETTEEEIANRSS